MFWNRQENELAFCEQCGDSFVRKRTEDWKTLCVDCYKAKKERERSARETLDLQADNKIIELQHKLMREQKQREELEDEIFALRFEAQAWRMIRPEIKTLIALCHPDKHGGSAAATKATQLLLSLRE